MPDKKSSDYRRTILKSIAASSGVVVAGKSLPKSWSKPVIDSIVLPVHAEMTDSSDSGSGGETTTPAPCCLVEQQYCTRISPTLPDLKLYVTTDGTITIDVDSNAVPEFQVTIPCLGGDFSGTSGSYTVAGSVGCNATSIVGKVSIINAPGVFPYEAKASDCD